MEKKNKRMLLILGVLLLLGGVSLAYFIGSSMFGGLGSTVEGITANINGAELKIEGNLEFNDLDILPGHKNISSIKVIATGNNELIPYNLIWKGTNSLNTPLKYTVYKTSNEIEVNTTCEKKSKIENGAQILNEECTITNEDKLGNIISSGTINKSEEETKEILVSEEFITATSDGMSVYYYIILEYPNLDEDQNIDMGGNFNGTVTVEESNAKPDINILAVKVEQEDGTYQDTTDIPQEGYTLNTEKSVCSNGATPTGRIPNITINNLTESGTSCYLYFDKKLTARDLILGNVGIESIKESPESFTGVATSDEGVFKAEDDDGDTYYFRGAVSNNYVRFAGRYWRIIRINGDGGIRIIYDGESAKANGNKLTLEESMFNSGNNNMYVGFKYAKDQVHGTDNESLILQKLNTWYANNLLNYEDEIDANAGFCNDREPSTSSTASNGSGGTGTTTTYYGAYLRILSNGSWGTNQIPTFKCKNNSDLFTKSGSLKGNKSLTNPIGLITADEVVYAGGFGGTANSSYYLYTGQSYWTMSPSLYTSNYFGTKAFYVSSSGSLAESQTSNIFGIRPVINLRSDVTLTGTGTASDPYVVN